MNGSDGIGAQVKDQQHQHQQKRRRRSSQPARNHEMKTKRKQKTKDLYRENKSPSAFVLTFPLVSFFSLHSFQNPMVINQSLSPLVSSVAVIKGEWSTLALSNVTQKWHSDVLSSREAPTTHTWLLITHNQLKQRLENKIRNSNRKYFLEPRLIFFASSFPRIPLFLLASLWKY